MLKESTDIDALVRKAVFGTEDEKAHARWLIWETGQKAGVRPASIHELYMARGRGDVPAFTTPAMNVRILSYDTGRAIFRAAKRLDAAPSSAKSPAARSPTPISGLPSTSP
jgi:hypothetical protein